MRDTGVPKRDDLCLTRIRFAVTIPAIIRPHSGMPRTDSELWEAVRSGNSEAWSELIRRYQALVYAVATRAGLSVADAADCFQQTWVALYENRRRLREPARLSAWLVTTARREALRLLREGGRSVGGEGLEQMADAHPLPDEELKAIRRQAELETAVGALDERCRQLIELFFFEPEKRSYEDIAATLGMAPNSLGARRRRCLERLRKILTENGVDTERNADLGPL